MKKRNQIKQALMLIITVALCGCLTACDASDYKQAEALYNNGDYGAACEFYSDLGDYKDSNKKLLSCQYCIAKSLFEDARYEDALSAYEGLGEYVDAREKANICRYFLANELFEGERYEEALAIYELLGDYEDCVERITLCGRKIGMATNADYEFLSDVEASVLSRMGSADDVSYTTLVNTELAYLGEYSDASFYDGRLQELATEYLDGLFAQRDALKAEENWEEQVEWQRGVALRYDALTHLYEEYGLLEDNPSFVAAYVMQSEYENALYEAYKEIEADISAQTNADTFTVTYDFADDGRSGTTSFVIKNNTEYTYSTVFELSFLSAEDTIFYSNSAYIEDIKPGSSYVVSVYADFTDCSTSDFYFNWNNYYTEVQV